VTVTEDAAPTAVAAPATADPVATEDAPGGDSAGQEEDAGAPAPAPAATAPAPATQMPLLKLNLNHDEISKLANTQQWLDSVTAGHALSLPFYAPTRSLPHCQLSTHRCTCTVHTRRHPLIGTATRPCISTCVPQAVLRRLVHE
jgi:hypothetical protein